MNMKKNFWKMAVVSILLFILGVHAAESKPLIQVAILLDTSGSMDGLINQARGYLWNMVNEFAKARKEGEKPELQVALFEYGNDNISAEAGWVRLIVPFTTDLDRVAEELFTLRTNGGTECCGYVIKDAVEKLQWSKSNDDYKVIFIAGNEPFTQGSVDYRGSCKNAIKKGIIVNTIHCGDYHTGVNSGWKDGADIADGMYSYIDQNKVIASIETPYDKEIVRLGQELNKTYFGYGKKGEEGKKRQKELDVKTEENSIGGFLSRQVAKASIHYSNADWDLVDAYNQNSIDLSEIGKDELPEEIKNMSVKEQKEYIGNISRKREEIKKKINELNIEREKYITEKATEISRDDTLDKALIQAIKTQSEKKHFVFN
ncbi:MAG TPA: VWA domain-containing protein [bacterium]|nr:VWA domain-containing protein [bacterium]HPP30337.1 VWA domain-containing protein [bacterium]